MWGYSVVDIPCGDIPWWIYHEGISRGGYTMWGYPVVDIVCGDISWWIYHVGISRGGYTMWGYLVVDKPCGDNFGNFPKIKKSQFEN